MEIKTSNTYHNNSLNHQNISLNNANRNHSIRSKPLNHIRINNKTDERLTTNPKTNPKFIDFIPPFSFKSIPNNSNNIYYSLLDNCLNSQYHSNLN